MGRTVPRSNVDGVEVFFNLAVGDQPAVSDMVHLQWDSTTALARATSAATDMEKASAISAATVATATATAVAAKEMVLK